jgi:hypothetical protein
MEKGEGIIPAFRPVPHGFFYSRLFSRPFREDAGIQL